MSLSSADGDLEGGISISVVRKFARSTGLMMSRRELATTYVNACGLAAAPRFASEPLTYRFPTSDEFERVATQSLRRLTDAAVVGESIEDIDPAVIASNCTRPVSRLSQILTMADACYTRYGLDRMWLDCSGLAHGPGSICSIYWQMYMLMAAILSTSANSPIEGKPDDYLENYYSLDLAFSQIHIEETKFSFTNASTLVKEVRNGERDRDSLTFFSDILSCVREIYPSAEKLQWWLAIKLAVERGRDISSGLLRAYQIAAGVESCSGTLVLDELLPMHSDRYILQYMLLSDEGSLFMETSEGFVLKVTSHKTPGEVGIYTYEESSKPESYTRVRHLIGGNFSADCSEALCQLLADECGHVQARIQSVLDARTDVERCAAAALTMHSILAMSPADGWEQIVKNGITICAIERLAKNGRMPAASIRTKLFGKTISVMSCQKVDIVLKASLGRIEVRAVASKKWGINDPEFDRRGRLRSYNTTGGLTDNSSLFDYLVSEGVARPRWAAHVLLELCAFMEVYGSPSKTMLDTRFLGPSPWPSVTGLENHVTFEIDRTEDVSSYSDHSAD